LGQDKRTTCANCARFGYNYDDQFGWQRIYRHRQVHGAQGKGRAAHRAGSVQVIGTIGDESDALILVTFRIGNGAGGTMVTMARACLYFLDENKKIKEERDSFFALSSKL
jgi:hypothetical protein